MIPDAPPRDTPGVVGSPPLIFAGILVLGLAVDYLAGLGPPAPLPWRIIAGSILLLGAACFITPALGQFRRAGTKAVPWKPSTAIVTTGVYRLTRNPMYVGMALAYLGLAILGGGIMTLVLLPVAMLVIQRGVILREEAYLEGKFGADYLRYKAAVRRWL